MIRDELVKEKQNYDALPLKRVFRGRECYIGQMDDLALNMSLVDLTASHCD
jgi:hypothetical protein